MEQLLLIIPALACPVGMGVCMWMMAKHKGGSKKDEPAQAQAEPGDHDHSKASAGLNPVTKI